MWTGARHGAPGASTAVWPSVGGRRRQRCAELVPRQLHAVACGVRSSVDLPPQSGGRQVPAAGKAVHAITDHKKNAAWAADPTLRGLGSHRRRCARHGFPPLRARATVLRPLAGRGVRHQKFSVSPIDIGPPPPAGLIPAGGQQQPQRHPPVQENPMNTRFERTGPLTEITSYPQWAQDMVADCESTRNSVVEHSLWTTMKDGTLGMEGTVNFMVGIWPVIERFPGYMAKSLLKTQFGRSEGDNLARRWLVRNIRVEQNHAEYWLNWAEGAGIPRERVLNGRAPHGTQTLAEWCEQVSSGDSLAASIAATNYAVEGATGDWSQILYESKEYAERFPSKIRAGAMRWLQLHAAYDDTHPWEALEIVCTLMGTAPAAHEVSHVGECIKRSYTSMRILADRCVQPSHALESLRGVAA